MAQPQIRGYKPNPADPDNPFPAGLGTICDELYQAAAGNPRTPDEPLPVPPELWKIVGIRNSHNGKFGTEADFNRPAVSSIGIDSSAQRKVAQPHDDGTDWSQVWKRSRRGVPADQPGRAWSGGEHPMSQRMDKESTSALIKLIIFCVLTGMATVVLGMTLSNGGFARRDVYKAMFTDVAGVAAGDEVRIAGVRVGSVRSVEIADKDKAVLEFGDRAGYQAHAEHHGDLAVPQPGRSALHGPRAGL